MKLLLVILTALVPLLHPVFAQDSSSVSEAPYIYYYSDVLTGIVIERADGTESRLIPLPQDAVLGYSYGAGWSPSGRWVSFLGRVLSLDGRYLSDLEHFRCPNMMLWHPREDILLVFGTQQPYNRCDGFLDTYWLIDVETTSLLASVTIESPINEGNPIVYWLDDGLMFYDERRDFGVRTYFRVAMHYDGNIDIRPISAEEHNDPLSSAGPDRRGLENWRDDDNVYPEFTIPQRLGSDTTVLPFEIPISSETGRSVLGWLWDANSEWIFLVYREFYSDGIVPGMVSIYHPSTSVYRELSSCGVEFTCIGWLPQRVQLENLPEGGPLSVMPAPLIYQGRDVMLDRSRVDSAGTHRLECDQVTGLRTQVHNIETGEIDFVLPLGETCSQIRIPPDFVFALSPSRQFYATGPFTQLFNADTGERIVALNFEGYRLSFSDDSSILYTQGRFADAAWRIEDMLHHAD